MSSSLLKPSVTPFTALFASARARPWNARCWRSSFVRWQLSSAPWSANVMPGGTGVVSLPLGPCTSTVPSLIWILTSLGTAMTLRPTRDMSVLLPDVAEDLAAHALAGGGLAGHQAAGGGEDVDAQAAVHAGDLVLAAVDAAAGPSHALQVGDDPLHAGAVLEEHAQVALLVVLAQLEVRDVALVLQDAGDLDLQLGPRHVHLGQLRAHTVPDPGEQVRDGIGHVHGCFLPRLPAGLHDARDVPGEGQLAETDAAHLELPEIPPGPATLAAARVLADRELRGALGLGDERRLGHYLASCCVRNGMPRYWSRSRLSSSVRAEVTNVTFMPRILSTLA